MEKFKSFITEEKNEPYKIVVLSHQLAGVRDTKDDPDSSGTALLVNLGGKLGLDVFKQTLLVHTLKKFLVRDFYILFLLMMRDWFNYQTLKRK